MRSRVQLGGREESVGRRRNEQAKVELTARCILGTFRSPRYDTRQGQLRAHTQKPGVHSFGCPWVITQKSGLSCVPPPNSICTNEPRQCHLLWVASARCPVSKVKDRMLAFEGRVSLSSLHEWFSHMVRLDSSRSSPALSSVTAVFLMPSHVVTLLRWP